MTNIAKGTKVELRTTNGGYSVVTLVHEYRPTYSAEFRHAAGRTFVVMADRIKSVQVAA